MTVTRLQQNPVSPPVLQLNEEPMENISNFLTCHCFENDDVLQ